MTGEPWRVLALPPLPHEVLQSLFGDPRTELVTPPSARRRRWPGCCPTSTW
jgi:hypothetical protein